MGGYLLYLYYSFRDIFFAADMIKKRLVSSELFLFGKQFVVIHSIASVQVIVVTFSFCRVPAEIRHWPLYADIAL